MSICLLLLFPSVTSAAVSLTDFSRAYELNTTIDGAIYKIPLPKLVYEGLVQSQNRDLAVFNADGQIVPFALREPAQEYSFSERPEQSVPFYELPPDLNEKNEGLDVYVSTGAGGRIISVKSGGETKSEKSFRRYVLDFSFIARDGEAIKHELRFTLPDEKISAMVSIFESDNLRDWDLLIADAPLMRLQNNDARLVSDRVELLRAPGRYVLLNIADAAQSFELKGTGYSVTERSLSVREEKAVIEGTPVTGTPVIGREGGFMVEYDALGAFPVSEVNFILREPGFYQARFFSRASAEHAWLQRANMQLSMIRNQNPDGSVSYNAPMPIRPREDRYWRLEFEGAFSAALPEMEMHWRPAEVFFLAQGKAPYVLAFGSNLELPVLQNSAFLRDRETSAVEAALGAPVSFDAAPVSTAPPESEETAEWQRYMVWGLLVLGGLLLSGIALKLLKTK